MESVRPSLSCLKSSEGHQESQRPPRRAPGRSQRLRKEFRSFHPEAGFDFFIQKLSSIFSSSSRLRSFHPGAGFDGVREAISGLPGVFGGSPRVTETTQNGSRPLTAPPWDPASISHTRETDRMVRMTYGCAQTIARIPPTSSASCTIIRPSPDIWRASQPRW